MTRLQERYIQTIQPQLAHELQVTNRLALPRLIKVVLNVGVGEAKDNQKWLDEVKASLGAITGQQPVVTQAKQAIAGFKIRTGQLIGVRVTLRGQRMYDFLDKLVSIALPRLRDFRGLPVKGLDGHGNYNAGIKEHAIFPEIQFDQMSKTHGLNVSIVTTAQTDNAARALLEQLGFPFEKGA